MESIKIASAARSKSTGEIVDATNLTLEEAASIFEGEHRLIHGETFHAKVRGRHLFYQLEENENEEYVVGLLMTSIRDILEGDVIKRQTLSQGGSSWIQ